MTQVVRVPISGALYVAGTVNGVEKIWTQEEAGWWSTTADRTPDGNYQVALSIVYGDGRTAMDTVTLYYGLVLVTDRTEQDVMDGTKKGSYNASDLNRVGVAMAYLRDRLNGAGYDIKINPRTDWKETNVPTEGPMTVYLECLGTLRGAIMLPEWAPVVPETMSGLTYWRANDIERILKLVDQMLSNSLTLVFCAGDLYCGEV